MRCKDYCVLCKCIQRAKIETKVIYFDLTASALHLNTGRN